MQFLIETPTRSEEIQFEIKLAYEEAQKYKELTLVKQMLSRCGNISPGDTLNITYKFWCHYYGEIVDHLKSINTLLKDANISDVDVDCITHMKSLIVEVLKQVETLKWQINTRNRGTFVKRVIVRPLLWPVMKVLQVGQFFVRSAVVLLDEWLK